MRIWGSNFPVSFQGFGLWRTTKVTKVCCGLIWRPLRDRFGILGSGLHAAHGIGC